MGGNFPDFQVIAKEYTQMVYSIGFRLLRSQEEAKDVVQETFIKLHRNRSQFTEGKNLKNWIYTIALNTARDHYRSKKRKQEEILTEETLEITAKSGKASLEDQVSTRKMMDILPLEHKEVIVLYYFEGCTVAEVAAIMGIDESLVKVRLHRARKSMLKYYEDNDGL